MDTFLWLFMQLQSSDSLTLVLATALIPGHVIWCRSQWPRGLMHELPSPARTLE
jgi:hypothetical protein